MGLELLSLALKNLGRDWRRTTTRILGISVITACLIVWGSLANGFSDLLFRATTSLDSGMFQVHKKGYLTSSDFYQAVQLDQRLEQARDRGFKASPRWFSYALAHHKDRSHSVRIIGLDAHQEAKVTAIHDHLAQGGFIGQDQMEVVLGHGLAHHFRVSLGDEIAIIGRSSDGAIASGLYKVGGILKPISPAGDRRHLYMDHRAFRDLFLIHQKSHEVAFNLPEQFSEAQGLDYLRDIFKGDEVKSWRQIKGSLATMLDLLSVVNYFCLGFVYIALAGIIFNLNLMTVYDRYEEYGTLRAIGMLPHQIFSLFMLESLWLTGAVAILGSMLGVPATLYLERHGFDVRFAADSIDYAGVIVEPLIYASIGLSEFIAPIMFLLVTMMVTSILPAKNAATVDPLTAMKGGVAT